MAEILVNLDKVTVSLAGKVIFAELDWELQRGQRVGLVGPNGVGKSTLFKAIMDELPLDDGNIFRLSGMRMARLAQEPELPPGKTVFEEAITAVPAIAALEQKLADLEARMGEPDVYTDAARLAKVMAQHEKTMLAYEQQDGPRYTSRVKDALARLGFPQARWDTLTEHLSGGQKKLVMLVKLLVQEPDLLLLDEPDNHLDLTAKRKLEQMIRSYDGCVAIISHDRYLLDEVVTHIAEMENGRLTLYQGNYTAYVNEREIRRLRQQQLYVAQQKEIAKIEAAIKRFELWASLVVDERHIKQARSRQKMLDKMDKVEKVSESRRMSLALDGWRGSKKTIELVDVEKVFDNGDILYAGLNMTLWHGERVGLVGPNGAGKSMLFKMLLDPEVATGGQVKIGPSCKIGYYAQEQETLDYSQTPIEAIRNTAPVSQETAVAFLNRFLFSYAQVQGPIANLSGGERSRLQLAKLVLEKPNLLILDEPTNNLDITSIEVLEETLEEFVGSVLVISHDRYFLDKVVDRIVELRDGDLTEFLGGYTDYLDELELI
ncbi:MAG: ABC-F family ATP-binding cassette domain-containing protein [Anaerolineae bacterium]|nr:ABC-F family ATP-binding cassette domain-containing protein [Anaerolineae bacterium]